jgi:AcrR family transcriptional regulator
MHVNMRGMAEDSDPTLPRSRKAEQSEATRAALVAAGRDLFAREGFGGVGTEEIVRAAGVTRGALYHHFTGKEDLFRAVYEEIEAKLVEAIAAGALATATDPLSALRDGAKAFLDAAADDEAIRQIALIDAPSVLGWEQWREIGLRYGFGLVEASLSAAMEAGLIEQQPVRPLTHLMIGALDEAAMVIARADDDGTTRREVSESIGRMIEALRPR